MNPVVYAMLVVLATSLMGYAPFFGVLSGWLILGEVVQWHVYLGGLFIFLGIFLVNWTAPGKALSHD